MTSVDGDSPDRSMAARTSPAERSGASPHRPAAASTPVNTSADNADGGGMPAATTPAASRATCGSRSSSAGGMPVSTAAGSANSGHRSSSAPSVPPSVSIAVRTSSSQPNVHTCSASRAHGPIGSGVPSASTKPSAPRAAGCAGSCTVTASPGSCRHPSPVSIGAPISAANRARSTSGAGPAS